MSVRRWLLELEAGRVIVGALLIAIILGIGITHIGNSDASPEPPQSSEQQSRSAQPRSPSVLAAQGQSPPAEYKADCSTKGDADLCAQRRAAQASEKLLALTDRQITIGWIGLAGVIVSLLLTAAATLYAAQSARTARDALLSVDRPIVFEDRFESGHKQDATGAVTEVTFRANTKNGGNTPAVNLRSHANLTIPTSDLPDDFTYPDVQSTRPDATSKMGPGQEHEMVDFEIPIAIAIEAHAGTRFIFLYGWLE
jgi:hypothetical protein